MKLQQLNEARLLKSPIVDWVEQAAKKMEDLVTKYYRNETNEEEIGREAPDVSPKSIIAALDGMYERIEQDWHSEGEHYWEVKTIPHPKKKAGWRMIKIRVVYDENNNLIVVFWI